MAYVRMPSPHAIDRLQMLAIVRRISTVLCTLLCSTASACELLHEIGSDCTHGACATTPGLPGEACLIESWTRTLLGDEEALVSREVSLVRDAEGRVPCELRWTPRDPRQVPDVLRNCRGFLEPESTGAPACRVQQVPVVNGAPLSGREGFYFLEASASIPGSIGAFRFTPRAVPTADVQSSITCTTAATLTARAGLTSTAADSCASPAPTASSRIGAACVPDITPLQGFDSQDVYLENTSRACNLGSCLVFHLAGSTDPECGIDMTQPVCASARALRERAFCSCRCGPAGQGGAKPCTCPDDFRCVPSVVALGPFAGSYCVPAGTAELF